MGQVIPLPVKPHLTAERTVETSVRIIRHPQFIPWLLRDPLMFANWLLGQVLLMRMTMAAAEEFYRQYAEWGGYER